MTRKARRRQRRESLRRASLPLTIISELRGLLLAADEKEVVRAPAAAGRPADPRRGRQPVLAEAVTIRSQEDRQLTDALMPTVEEAIVRSVHKNPEVLVDALFPGGTGDPKGHPSTFAEMLESLNQTLGQSFSAQGFKWRIEAWRTGKSFSEVVLRCARSSSASSRSFSSTARPGCFSSTSTRRRAGVQDADMISGMLTAIRDFVHDSFGGNEAGGPTPSGSASSPSGWSRAPGGPGGRHSRNLPRELRGVSREAIEKIHRDQARALADFQGTPARSSGAAKTSRRA
jgi:OOP family OmpA-OmpF porin